MGQKRHTLAVFIGRFQPFHIGHHDVLEMLAGKADSTLVLVGSAYRPRSWKNPFTFNERRAFIEQGTADIDMPVDVLPLVDTLYNDRSWSGNVRMAVKLYMRAKGLNEAETEVVLTGFEKDKSSRYLSWFPDWKMLPASPSTHEGEIISATDLREALFFPDAFETGRISERFGNRQTGVVVDWMKRHTEVSEEIRYEGAFVRSTREKAAEAEAVYGFAIPINTSDSVVIQSGHILLVRRASQPGKGTLALPGGHILRDETSFDAALRSLRNETRLDVPKGALAGRLRDRKIFDHPERSERGWVRTEAFFFELQDRAEMEKIKTTRDEDDLHIEKALWVPLSEITPDEMFEDHFDIIQSFVPDVTLSYSSILMSQVEALRA